MADGIAEMVIDFPPVNAPPVRGLYHDEHCSAAE